MNDLKFAFRQLWKTPGFTIAAVTVLALGIGVNTAIFSLVNAMFFAAAALAKPAEMVQLFSQDKKDPKSFALFLSDLLRHPRAEHGLLRRVAHRRWSASARKGTRGARWPTRELELFPVLGFMPALGRAFSAGGRKARAQRAVAIVSYSYWKKHGRDPALLGRRSRSMAAPSPSSASCRKDLPAR